VTKKQHTLADTVDIEGVGLFFGKPVHLRCLPAPADTGLVFVRTDLPESPRIEACLENVPGPQRWTGLRVGDVQVNMIEHFLAACCGLGIQNMIVEVDSQEMPVGDGSAKPYVDAFLRVGQEELDAPVPEICLQQAVAITDKDVVLTALPSDEGLLVTYILDYGQHFLRSQALTLDINLDAFVCDIAPARTYVLRPEVDAFVKQGLGKGATPENTIVLEENGDHSGELRFPDECARHKILDLLGDLCLAGASLSARVVGYKSGHATNVRLAASIREACVHASLQD